VLDVDSPWPVRELLDRHGVPPLPPYITRYDAPKPEDRERYQTVYARDEGSIAAPTAGLHFTAELIQRLERIAVEVHSVTLHVGPSTFRPLKAGRVEDNYLAPEEAEVSEGTARAVNRAKGEGRRVIAVGTSTTRTLEWAAEGTGRIRAIRGAADPYIYPGHEFRIIDGLMTNFHLSRSSVLLLTSAFCGRNLLFAAYRHAIAARYRFYSFGDAMLIV
jgi:S-adenosylmethionine:tRNA ribosyltransferase-isomerase